MRMLFFLYSLEGGGAERVTAELANHWAGKGRTVKIVTIAAGRSDFYHLDSRIQRVCLSLDTSSGNVIIGAWQNVKRILALRRELRRFQPDVAIAMMTTANVLLAWAARGLGGIVTVGSERVHPPAFDLGMLWSLARRRSYSYLDIVVAQTRKSEAWLRANTNARRVEIVPNPAVWPLVRREPIVIPSAIVAEGDKVLLAVGRMDRQKGFDMLLKAFSTLAGKHPDWQLVLLGEGSSRPLLEAQARKLELAGRVHFPGRVGNIGDWYERAQVFVLSSRFEGFPNTLVEAMAYGVAVVSFDCDTGPGDIIQDGQDGLLVRPEDDAALADTLDNVMTNDAIRRGLSARASDIRRRLSLANVAQQWEKLFMPALERPPAP